MKQTGRPIIVAIGCLEEIRGQKFPLRDVARLFHVSEEDTHSKYLNAASIILTRSLHHMSFSMQKSLKEDQLIICMGPPDERVELHCAQELNLQVASIDVPRSEEVAETIFSLLLNFTRKTEKLAQHGCAHTSWLDTNHDLYYGIRRLRGKTLGLIGANIAAKELSLRALAFGLKVLFFINDGMAPEDHKMKKKMDGCSQMKTLEDLLSESDFVSLHCTLTEETEHIINSESLKSIKKGAFLLNASHPGLLQDYAVKTSIGNGTLGGCALDGAEPYGWMEAWVNEHPNVMILPRSAEHSVEAWEEVQEKTWKQLRIFLETGSLEAAPPPETAPVEEQILEIDGISLDGEGIFELDVVELGEADHASLEDTEREETEVVFAPIIDALPIDADESVSQNVSKDSEKISEGIKESEYKKEESAEVLEQEVQDTEKKNSPQETDKGKGESPTGALSFPSESFKDSEEEDEAGTRGKSEEQKVEEEEKAEFVSFSEVVAEEKVDEGLSSSESKQIEKEESFQLLPENSLLEIEKQKAPLQDDTLPQEFFISSPEPTQNSVIEFSEKKGSPPVGSPNLPPKPAPLRTTGKSMEKFPDLSDANSGAEHMKKLFLQRHVSEPQNVSPKLPPRPHPRSPSGSPQTPPLAPPPLYWVTTSGPLPSTKSEKVAEIKSPMSPQVLPLYDQDGANHWSTPFSAKKSQPSTPRSQDAKGNSSVLRRARSIGLSGIFSGVFGRKGNSAKKGGNQGDAPPVSPSESPPKSPKTAPIIRPNSAEIMGVRDGKVVNLRPLVGKGYLGARQVSNGDWQLVVDTDLRPNDIAAKFVIVRQKDKFGFRSAVAGKLLQANSRSELVFSNHSIGPQELWFPHKGKFANSKFKGVRLEAVLELNSFD